MHATTAVQQPSSQHLQHESMVHTTENCLGKKPIGTRISLGDSYGNNQLVIKRDRYRQVKGM